MKHTNLYKRLRIPGLAGILCLTFTLTASAQTSLSQQPSRCRESLSKEKPLTRHESARQQQYPYLGAKHAQKDGCRQWWQGFQGVHQTAYPNDYSYNDYVRSTYPSNNAGFRWNDVAAVTAIALGAYILFR
ncbi:hypothetical protein [Chitinophaga sp.]|uniref:hypothetical protein n=1 Tax=Chitinophaga sp. TaxID=1869181 RepID=UPI002F9426D3